MNKVLNKIKSLKFIYLKHGFSLPLEICIVLFVLERNIHQKKLKFHGFKTEIHIKILTYIADLNFFHAQLGYGAL